MIINLSPQVRDEAMVLRKKGDILTINGQAIDFSPLPEGAVLPASAVDCEFVIGEIKRENGHIVITLILPIHWADTDDAKYPVPIVSPKDGIVNLPGGLV